MSDIDCTGMGFEQATKVAELLADNERLRDVLQTIAAQNSEHWSKGLARRALKQKP